MAYHYRPTSDYLLGYIDCLRKNPYRPWQCQNAYLYSKGWHSAKKKHHDGIVPTASNRSAEHENDNSGK